MRLAIQMSLMDSANAPLDDGTRNRKKEEQHEEHENEKKDDETKKDR